MGGGLLGGRDAEREALGAVGDAQRRREDDALGWVVAAVGLVLLVFPQVAFALDHATLKDAGTSATGDALYRLLGGTLSVVGLGMVAW